MKRTTPVMASSVNLVAPLGRTLAWATRMSSVRLTVVGFVPIPLIGVLNYYTSPYLSASFFYLLPILFVTHFLGRGAGAVAAILATVLWLWADISGTMMYGMARYGVPFLNAVMRFGVFLVVVWLVSAMRLLMETLERRVEQRTAQLQQESAERRDLEQRILDVSEREQARMGQDLHDGLCQHLVGTAFSANMLLQRLEVTRHPEAAAVVKIANLLDEAITQARRLVRGLYPVRIEELGFSTALREIAEHVRSVFGVDCRFKEDGDPVDLEQTVAVHLYRIAQEAVANAVKHARSTCIRIELHTTRREIEVEVGDNGIGIRSGDRSAGGVGLRIMEFRARMIGARFDIMDGPGVGTVVRCVMPLPACAD